MKQATLNRIIPLLETLPEKKVHSLMDYINYLIDQQDSFSEEEVTLIKNAQEEALYGKGVNWREIKR
ncbi:MAG: hypothetical protein HZA78_12645 [Candidatus Schekmanbacteria bacterium]|nr:hypothetical protein [Candidatus Schekmanbacteria bacterium]